MTLADEARDNALSCEMVKCAYRQTKDGVVVSLVIHPQEVPKGLATAPLGTRYMVALVQIGDDERPVAQTGKEAMPNPQRSTDPVDARPQPTSVPAGAKRPWEDLQPQQQAGIRCGEPIFWAFLKETHPKAWHETSDAAECVRYICGVHSRVELGTNQRARVMWHSLDEQFGVWKAKERVGG